MLRPGHDLYHLNRIVLRDARASRWLVFDDPEAVLVADSVSDVRDVIDAANRRVQEDGLYAAGFVSYEAAAAFDAALSTHGAGRLPLACFGLFREPEYHNQLPSTAGSRGKRPDWALTSSRHSYLENLEKIKRQIELGNSYQVNYTIRQQAQIAEDAWTLFAAVAADAPYAAFLDFDDFAIVSASPELFFSLSGTRLECRPMKGTSRRGMTTSEDNAAAMSLRRSPKDRAENVMITDMLRNDMGRIAVPGSVQVDSLYDVEKYRTVWQMTSSVSATTAAELPEILQALFPCASVTGAPKAASMKIIAELEDSPREIYTGTIGFLAPGREARFSVAIRTAWLDKKTHSATYGIGGGIVWDSDPDAEFEECLSKARVLDTSAAEHSFSILETMLWTSRDGYYLLDEHLERLRDSAEYFDFEFDRARVLNELADFSDAMESRHHRVRLLLDRDGTIRFEQAKLPDIPDSSCQRIALAADPVDIDNPFLYHKTTNRSAYEQALACAGPCDDVLLWNTSGDITETTIANVIVRIGDALYTPPISCGLLAGTYRERMLRDGQISERKIHVDELTGADEIILVNSVRGEYRAEIVKSSLPRRREDHRMRTVR